MRNDRTLEGRLFLLDKNYILKQAQRDAQSELLKEMLKVVKSSYFEQHNPLHLMDATSEKIQHFTSNDLSSLAESYQILAGIFRYQIGDNQLELLFDGTSHYEKYLADWTDSFLDYLKALCKKRTFLMAALELTVFPCEPQRLVLVQNRLKMAIFEHFELKIYKHKGIQDYKSRTASSY